MKGTLSLDTILGDFQPECGLERAPRRLAVTFWLLPEEKALYDQLQATSGKRFAKKAREALLALMQLADQRAGQKAG